MLLPFSFRVILPAQKRKQQGVAADSITLRAGRAAELCDRVWPRAVLCIKEIQKHVA